MSQDNIVNMPAEVSSEIDVKEVGKQMEQGFSLFGQMIKGSMQQDVNAKLLEFRGVVDKEFEKLKGDLKILSKNIQKDVMKTVKDSKIDLDNKSKDSVRVLNEIQESVKNEAAALKFQVVAINQTIKDAESKATNESAALGKRIEKNKVDGQIFVQGAIKNIKDKDIKIIAGRVLAIENRCSGIDQKLGRLDKMETTQAQFRKEIQGKTDQIVNIVEEKLLSFRQDHMEKIIKRIELTETRFRGIAEVCLKEETRPGRK